METVRSYGHSAEKLLEIATSWDARAQECAETYGENGFWTRESRQRAAAYRLAASFLDARLVYGEED